MYRLLGMQPRFWIRYKEHAEFSCRLEQPFCWSWDCFYYWLILFSFIEIKHDPAWHTGSSSCYAGFLRRGGGWYKYTILLKGSTCELSIREGEEILVAPFETSTQLTELNFYPVLPWLTECTMNSNSFFTHLSKYKKHEKKSLISGTKKPPCSVGADYCRDLCKCFLVSTAEGL